MRHTKLFLLFPLTLSGLMMGCAQEAVEVNVFAAASLTETLNAIQEKYEAKNNVKLVYNFDSSGKLKTQIENGAACDLFISAAPKQINELTELDKINTETKIDLLENKVALAVPDNNPKNVTSITNLFERLSANEEGFILAMGNSDVPVGQYTQKIFQHFGVDETTVASQGHITYGGNVKEVTSVVANAGAACGIIYQTDAKSANLTVVGTATKDMCGQVIYPAALIKNAQQEQAAKDFLAYLQGEEAMAIFEGVGFSKITQLQ